MSEFSARTLPFLMGAQVVGHISVNPETGEFVGKFEKALVEDVIKPLDDGLMSVALFGHPQNGVSILELQKRFAAYLERKNSMQQDVEKFMRACDQEVKKYPDLPSDEIRDLRIKLMTEELLGKDELVHSMKKGDLVGIADGLADVLYVVIGTAAAYGINAQEVFDEVQRSNMTKAVWDDDTQSYIVTKNEYGKVIKPPTFSPAELEPIVKRQIEAGKK